MVAVKKLIASLFLAAFVFSAVIGCGEEKKAPTPAPKTDAGKEKEKGK
jgi:hypothetical protein